MKQAYMYLIYLHVSVCLSVRLVSRQLACVYHWLTFLGDGDASHRVSTEGWGLRVGESQVLKRGSLWVGGCGRVYSNVPPTGVGGRPTAPQA